MREMIEFITLWFDDARVYLDGDELVVEVQGRKFLVPLGRFSEVQS